MALRGLYTGIAAMVLAIILAGSVLIYADRQARLVREENRETIVVFACLAVKFSDESDIREAFLDALAQLGHHC